MDRKIIFTINQFETAIDNLSQKLIDNYITFDNILFIGIQRRGVILANRLQKVIVEKTSQSPLIGTLDINFYRDDWTTRQLHPIIGESFIPTTLDDKKVILIDDVIYTGRTIRAALEALNNYGRPTHVKLLTLIDRGGRELPIQPDYIGYTTNTTSQYTINVLVKEIDGEDAVLLE